MPLKYRKNGERWGVQIKEGGKNKYYSRKTEQEIKDFIVMWEASKQQSAEITNTDEELVELIEQFTMMKYSNKSPDMRKNTKSALSITLPRINWKQPTMPNLYSAVSHYKSSTAKQHLKAVKNFMRYFKINDGIDWSELFRMIKKDDAKPKFYLTPDEFSKIIEASPDKYKLIFKFMATVGIRDFELTRLNVGDFDRNTWTITIQAAKAKSRKMRTNFVADEIKEDFLKYSQWQNIDRNAPLFHHNGSRISRDGLRGTFTDICKRIGLREDNNKKTLHLLRAYALYLMVKAGAPEMLIKNTCGWDSECMKLYTGLMTEQKNELAKNMTLTNTRIDTSVEFNKLVQQFNLLLLGYDRSVISRETGISIMWLNSFLDMKVNQDIEKLIILAKFCGYNLVIGENTHYISTNQNPDELSRN